MHDVIFSIIVIDIFIQVRPGLVSKDAEGKLTCRPIFSRIVSLYTEQNELQFAVPGGLIGVGTKIEPTLCRADRLVGQVLGAVGALPSIFIELEVICTKTRFKRRLYQTSIIRSVITCLNVCWASVPKVTRKGQKYRNYRKMKFSW